MSLSIKTLITLIVILLVLASALSAYFAVSGFFPIPLLVVAGVNLIVVLTLVLLITRGILTPLHRLRETVRRVGEGELNIKLDKSSVTEIKGLTDDFNMMVRKIAQAEELKTEFVSMAAHQMRTPLSSTKWALGAFLEEDFGKVTKEQELTIKRMQQTNEHMISLINELLDITELQEGRYLSGLKKVQLGKMVEEMVNNYKNEAKRRGLKISFKKGKERVPVLYADKEKVELAIQNYIDNALQYTKKGGTVTVTVGENERTNEVEVAVQDTGIGIPENQQKRIFNRFFRATNAQVAKEKGTGLGIYLVKNIAEAHGGKVWFESEEELMEGMNSAEGQKLGAALLKDEGNFIDHSRSSAFIVNEHEF